jgi:transposase
MGYTGTQSTLNRQIKAVEATGFALSTAKKADKVAILDDEQLEEIREWATDKNSKHQPISRMDVVAEISRAFGVTVHVNTAGNYMAKIGFSKKTCSTRTAGTKSTKEEKKAMIMRWSRLMKEKDMFFRSLSSIYSLDVMYTRRLARKVTTYSPKGGGKEQSIVKVLPFTDAIVTCPRADGVNATPAMLFTMNPKMARTQKDTPLGRAWRADFKAKLAEHKIDEDRIVFMPSVDGKVRHFCPESPAMYETFLKRHMDLGVISKDDLFLHDGGYAYKRKKVSIFDTLGFPAHETYPSDVHQHLSPNDNNIHGCKQQWSVEYPDFGDSVSSSLRLLHLIDLECMKNSRYYFQRNILDITKSTVEDMMRT